MNTASNKLPPSLDRSAGAGKPVDPATRLSELLAQSLEELTRPFDPPANKPSSAPVPLRPEHLRADPAAEEFAEDAGAEEPRIDADKALAELEAELFAAAQQVSRDLPDAPEAANEDIETDEEQLDHGDDGGDELEPAVEHLEASGDDHEHDDHDEHGDDEEPIELPPAAHLAERPLVDPFAEQSEPRARVAAAPQIVPAPFLALEPDASEQTKPDAAASAVIARVRKLMLVSMAVTLVAVGSVFAFIGYRVFKGEGVTAKTADKLPEASAIPTDITLSLPNGARVIQSAVSGDRLVITLEIGGKIEVRTFDVNTLQPAGRLNFADSP